MTTTDLTPLATVTMCPDCHRTDWPDGPVTPHQAGAPEGTDRCFGEPEESCPVILMDNPLDDGLVFQVVGAELFSVPSDSSDRIYNVVVVPGSKPHCTCPARTPHCKHVRRVLAARAGF